MYKITIVAGTCLILLVLAATVPIKIYERGGCFVYKNERLDLIPGENIENAIDEKQRNYIPLPNAGMCDPSLRKIRLYLL
ncbi:hypothetical protein COY17_03050 [Candidatus Saccharibacteria bacterium CG_4_10_14_0_2_um_filter_52_9]|nr:MAG: hypothetical protein COY17_03050 [Candidatus Saccharibacteria bacterium CG_4_10_14_0_2_um_filter_52_9]